jgi:hypothetical protein
LASWKYWVAAAGSMPERRKMSVATTPGFTEFTRTPLTDTLKIYKYK